MTLHSEEFLENVYMEAQDSMRHAKTLWAVDDKPHARIYYDNAYRLFRLVIKGADRGEDFRRSLMANTAKIAYKLERYSEALDIIDELRLRNDFDLIAEHMEILHEACCVRLMDIEIEKFFTPSEFSKRL